MENNKEMLNCVIIQILRDETGNLLVATLINTE